MTDDQNDARDDPAGPETRRPALTTDPPLTVDVETSVIAVERTATEDQPAGADVLRIAGKVASGLAALFLLVLSLQLMKGGSAAIAPTVRDSPLFSNGASTLGAGWLGAYVVLSGSPIAAVSLGLFSGGAITKLQTFTMLSGSRLGASFVVLLVGFLYSVRNRGANREESVGMGILALTLTTIVYVPGIAVGYGLMRSGLLDGIRWRTSGEVTSVVDFIWGPTQRLITDNVPGWLLLPAGLGIILLSFKLLDRVLPQVNGNQMTGKRAEWLKRPWPMFALGCLVATLTLSVSVALVVLVPLASRGYVRREQSIPYIMGANITTLADTLVAAMLLRNAGAVQIVVAQAIAVFLVSILYLAFAYDLIKRSVMGLDDWLIASNRRLWTFVVVLFTTPAILLTSGLWLAPFTR